jgi:hypothetical protein
MNKEIANKYLFDIINSDCDEEVVKSTYKICHLFTNERYYDVIYEFGKLNYDAVIAHEIRYKSIYSLSYNNFSKFIAALINYDLCYHDILIKEVVDLCHEFRSFNMDKVVEKYMKITEYLENNLLLGLDDLERPITELYDLSNLLSKK